MNAEVGEQRSFCPGQATWADDLAVAVLFNSPDASSVTRCVRTIAESAEKGLVQVGLAPNLSANKTEAMVVHERQRSTAACREAVCCGRPEVAFTQHDGSTERIRLVAEYVHLGTTLRCDLSEIPNMRRRERLMYSSYKPIRAKLLGNNFLTAPEKAFSCRRESFPDFSMAPTSGDSPCMKPKPWPKSSEGASSSDWSVIEGIRSRAVCRFTRSPYSA